MRWSVLFVIVVGFAAVPRQRPTFRSSESLVRIDVSVNNEHGPVTGLKASDFVLADNGVVQTPRVDEMQDAPLDLVTVVQPFESFRVTSREQPPALAEALRAFLARINERDRVGLLLATTPPVRLRALAFSKPAVTEKALQGSRYSALFDTMVAALGEFDASDRQRVLVAFTNAADFRSTVDVQTVVDIARRLGPVFLLVGAPTHVEQSVGVKIVRPDGRDFASTRALAAQDVFPSSLQSLAKSTGGLTLDVSKAPADDLMKNAFTWLRTRYVLSYEPPAGKGWHSLSVRTTHNGQTVSARDGYFIN